MRTCVKTAMYIASMEVKTVVESVEDIKSKTDFT